MKSYREIGSILCKTNRGLGKFEVSRGLNVQKATSQRNEILNIDLETVVWVDQ